MQKVFQERRCIPGTKYGFTLIEILISVTISAILMTGVLVFISSSLGSSMTNKHILEQNNTNTGFKEGLQKVFLSAKNGEIYASESSFSGGYLSGIVLQTKDGSYPAAFIGVITQSGYCDSFSGSESETGSVQKLVIRNLPRSIIENTTSYTLSSTGNAVFSGTTRLIGTSYPGNTLNTNSGALSELHGPMSLTRSGSRLYIADTLNNRILSYDTISGNIIEIAGQKDGILLPTSLYFSGNTLLIASSGNGKIFSLEDSSENNTVFGIRFRVSRNFGADSIKITFSGSPSITGPVSPGDLSFSGVSTNIASDTVSLVGSGLVYSGTTQNYVINTPYSIVIRNISGVNNIGNSWVTIDFQSSGNSVYKEQGYFQTQGDGSLESKTGNILRVIAEGLIYPKRITGPTTWTTGIDWNDILISNENKDTEIISTNPISNFNYTMSSGVLTIRYLEYTFYDCIAGKHRTEERVGKIKIPN